MIQMKLWPLCVNIKANEATAKRIYEYIRKALSLSQNAIKARMKTSSNSVIPSHASEAASHRNVVKYTVPKNE